MKKIIPSILTGDILDLENKLKKLKGVTDWVHIDIADGKFVNNTLIGLNDLSASRAAAGFSLEAHLMVFNPEKYFQDCRKADVRRVIFHSEAVDDLTDILVQAKKFDFRIGIALNPQTLWQEIERFVPQIDVVLLMTVNPGSGGQKFLEQVLPKIKSFRNSYPNVKIEVDGGINPETGKRCLAAGANILVSGSYIFGGKNIHNTVEQLKNI